MNMFRCVKQLCGRRLVLNLPLLNARFMSQAIVEIKDFDQNKDAERGNFSKFDISKETITKLKDADINHLFAVQYDTFNAIREGKDVIVQARTGTGKTLAFALPILENLREDEDEACVEIGRSPMVLALTPTRELALQIYKEFKKFKSQKTMVSCFYGGAPYFQQDADLHDGIDILVGTPGRILDHIEKNKLDCSNLKHVILDEADRMMDMGFQEDIDQILSSAYNEGNKPQTLLFSATVPSWVRQTAKKYTSIDTKQFDFIGSAVKSALSVEHKAIKCSYWERAATIKDIIQVYSGKFGKTIIFTSTKQEANELALNSVINMDSQVLHGDIQQNQREITLDSFRNGKFNCLIATDVASRGLDIPEIDLVIQTEPPNDLDSYIHRAGRTGRAGRNGISIIFYKHGQEDSVQAVEKKAGISFSRIGAPHQDELILSSANDAVKSLDEVKSEVIKHFIPSAKGLIESRGPENALAAALAFISGTTEMTSRSMLTSKTGYTTYLCEQHLELHSVGRIWAILKETLGASFTSSIGNMSMCKDKKGCVFDVPTDNIKIIEENWKGNQNATLEQVKELPELWEGVSSRQGWQDSSHDTFNNRGRGRGHGPPMRRNNNYNSNEGNYNNRNRNNNHNNNFRHNNNYNNDNYNNRNNNFNNRSNNFKKVYDQFKDGMDDSDNQDYSPKTTFNNQGTKFSRNNNNSNSRNNRGKRNPRFEAEDLYYEPDDY